MTPQQSAELNALLDEKHQCPNCTKTPMPEIGEGGYELTPCPEHRQKGRELFEKHGGIEEWRKRALPPLEEL
jgi:hypothetical protein